MIVEKKYFFKFGLLLMYYLINFIKELLFFQFISLIDRKLKEVVVVIKKESDNHIVRENGKDNLLLSMENILCLKITLIIEHHIRYTFYSLKKLKNIFFVVNV